MFSSHEILFYWVGLKQIHMFTLNLHLQPIIAKILYVMYVSIILYNTSMKTFCIARIYTFFANSNPDNKILQS